MPTFLPDDLVLNLSSLPSDYEQQFHDEIFENNQVVCIIFGNFDASEDLCDAASFFAMDRYFGIDRKVILIPDHDCLKDKCLSLLNTSNQFDATNYDQVLGMILNYNSHHAKSIFYTNEVYDELDVELKFWEASIEDSI